MARPENKNIFLNNIALKMILALTIVSVFSGVSLVFVYNYAIPKIKFNIENETQKAIVSIFPEGKKIKKINDKGTILQVNDENDVLLGYSFIAEGNGYQGTIKIIAGLDTSLNKLKGIEILESQETPGLGAEILAHYFKDQFNGIDATNGIKYVKGQKPSNPGEIQAITGATISSVSVVAILNNAINNVRKTVNSQIK
ncbi:electron transport complex, RnfABCDGE type, G subunit [Candidatus Omnitrophus magneticus]|uniref:Ion-translocating oxidoreductase complex subunit G n=1 Tax=Candidatus Omnitrophus magneticus TaxID=1609969 RepID=A0A0F0CTP6_9BACT|nr:electron transport complex, RnfABCDGE type, G subunit [Candidatus Omnitrophus magneticus]